jgi:hypothetical protein
MTMSDEPKEINMDGIVEIQGKMYVTVARRNQDMRAEHPEWGVETEIQSAGSEHVLLKSVIRNEEGRIMGTGHAEEDRSDGFINKTSAIENAETSAIGRALAACGYGSEFYASANEMQTAEVKQLQLKWLGIGIAYGRAFVTHEASIQAIKDAIAMKNIPLAIEAWDELDGDEKDSIWLAPTKGGCFTTEERRVMKSDEWGATRRELLGETK